MIHSLDGLLGRTAAEWIDRVRPRAGRVVAAFVLAAVAAAAYSAGRLGLHTDEEALFAEDVPFVRRREEFRRAFPGLLDPIVIVVEGPSLDAAEDAASALADRLAQDAEHFASIRRLEGGDFFENHGLLYLDLADLEALSDRLAAAQPYLAELAGDPSLRGLFGMLAQATRAAGSGGPAELDLATVMDHVSRAVEAWTTGSRHTLSWGELILGQQDEREGRRRFVLVEPVVDFARVAPAEPAILALRSAVRELGLDDRDGGGARARMTGVFALSYEESEHVGEQMTLAGIASFLLVGTTLLVGLRSWRLVVASLATLLVGLVLTAGFAAAAVGHLNLISVAFAVLFIGLSIDFAIHLCIRYAERLRAGDALEPALRGAAADVGASLALCAATTAIGFYAFVPTAYRGVGELGLIAGTGMFISLFCNLTLLPALVVILARPEQLRLAPLASGRAGGLLGIPVRHARAVMLVAGAAGLVGLALLPSVEFDPNPLRMRDPTTESVQTFNDLLSDGMAFPWNVSVLSPDLETAQETATQLEALESVAYTVTLADFVPERQEEKLAVLEETALLLGPALLPGDEPTPPSALERRQALEGLREALQAPFGPPLAPRLASAMARLRDALAGLRGAPAELADLESRLVGTLPERLGLLRSALDVSPLTIPGIPAELVETMRASDGRMRVEVFPAEDLNDNEALARYVAEVRSVAPDAFGEGLVILESGRTVVRALLQALAFAAIATLAILLALWRSPKDALLVAVPLMLAALLTAALSVILGVPLNFANVIVIPLLLGMGVDSGIHLVQRLRASSVPDGNLLRTSTARAVLFSALTTAASFGTLAFSSHPGMASLGQLLALGIGLVLTCNLVVLPALVALRSRA